MVIKIKHKNSRYNLIFRNISEFLIVIVVLAVIGVLSSQWFFRVDLTSEKRFTLSSKTRDILKNLNKDVYVQVFLDGEMPVGFKRMRTAIKDMLDEFEAYAGKHLTYEFINPSEGKTAKERDKYYQELYKKGLRPTDVQQRDKEGGISSKIIFPGAVINFNGMEIAVNFLNNNPSLPAAVNLNHSIEGIEYNMIRSIKTLSADTVYRIAFTEGHGELPEIEVEDVERELAKYFNIDRGVIGGKPGILNKYAAVIIAKPSKPFSEADKFVLDQYVMQGGKILWLLDKVMIDADSLIYASSTFGIPLDLHLNDMLFKYGVRLEGSLIQDMRCGMVPVNTAIVGNAPHYVPARWLYYPLMAPQKHPVSRNLNLVQGKFVNPLDTVEGNGKIFKHVLLRTSRYTLTRGAPLMVSLEEIKRPPPEKDFNRPGLITGVVLEGRFESVFRHRMLSTIIPEGYAGFKDESVPTRMIVFSDGDIIRNGVRRIGGKWVSLPLGQDRLTQQTYGNKDLIVNAVNYLVDDQNLMELRGREFKLRLLDREKINTQRLYWELFNTLLPVLLIIIAGIIVILIRKHKFASRR
ncbi:MAG TPA: gliding motility-associated ABC transporter substrate-binding protein GldG [Bacteroidetes bacterium]|nr:gliding motility-associated ABC transporter substrate-binding protein GldG [Bacteroidota bacterium]